MPLATSTAMINLDCRSRVLYFEKKKKNYSKLINRQKLSVNYSYLYIMEPLKLF